MAMVHPILLRPDLLKRLDRWQLPEPVHLCLRRLLHTGEQRVAVIPNALAQRLALCLVFGQAIILHPFPIARIPLGRNLLLEPVRRDRRQHLQGMAERFPDQFQLVERFDRSKDRGGVRALASVRWRPCAGVRTPPVHAL